METPSFAATKRESAMYALHRSSIRHFAIYALLFSLAVPLSAQWGNSYMTEKEKAEEKKRLEKERMEEREAAARERTERLRSDGQRGLSEITPRLDEANAWFKSVSELKRRHDATFGTNSLPSEVVAEAVRIRKTLVQCEREVSWLRQEISAGSSRTTRSVMADIEKNQAVARRVCDDAEAFARKTFQTSAGILSRSANNLNDKFKKMADRTEFLEWDDEQGLVLCRDSGKSGLHAEENELLKAWESLKPYRRLDPARIGTYEPDGVSVRAGTRPVAIDRSDDPWSAASDVYGVHDGSAWGTTGGLFDMFQPFADTRLKLESLWAGSADWDPKWKENKIARAVSAAEDRESGRKEIERRRREREDAER